MVQSSSSYVSSVGSSAASVVLSMISTVAFLSCLLAVRMMLTPLTAYGEMLPETQTETPTETQTETPQAAPVSTLPSDETVRANTDALVALNETLNKVDEVNNAESQNGQAPDSDSSPAPDDGGSTESQPAPADSVSGGEPAEQGGDEPSDVAAGDGQAPVQEIDSDGAVTATYLGFGFCGGALLGVAFCDGWRQWGLNGVSDAG